MDSTALPAGLEQLPSWHVDGAALDLVELDVAGLVRTGFPARDDLDAAVLPVSLPVPEGAAAAVRAAGRAVLEDAEGVPVALVEVTEVWAGPDDALLAAGSLTALKPLTHGAFRRSRLTPSQVRAAWGRAPSLLVATATPLSQDTVLQVAEKAGGEPVLVLALVGAG